MKPPLLEAVSVRSRYSVQFGTLIHNTRPEEVPMKASDVLRKVGTKPSPTKAVSITRKHDDNGKPNPDGQTPADVLEWERAFRTNGRTRPDDGRTFHKSSYGVSFDEG